MNFRRPFVFAAGTVLLCAVTIGIAWAQNGASSDLSRYRNRNRLALVFAPSAQSAPLLRQQALWKNKEAGFADRDLIAFTVLESGQSRRGPYNLPPADAAALRRRFGVKPGSFRVLLIGKDGHTTYSSTRPVVLDDLFGRIDKMPMRRDEVARRKNR